MHQVGKQEKSLFLGCFRGLTKTSPSACEIYAIFVIGVTIKVQSRTVANYRLNEDLHHG